MSCCVLRTERIFVCGCCVGSDRVVGVREVQALDLMRDIVLLEVVDGDRRNSGHRNAADNKLVGLDPEVQLSHTRASCASTMS